MLPTNLVLHTKRLFFFFTSTPGIECDAPYDRLASLVPSK